MRIGVVSDTHGDTNAICRVMACAGEVDAWIHLGDNIRDSEKLGSVGKPVFSVSGNCDVFGETEQVIGIGGAKVFITHGHMYGVNSSLDRFMYRAEELGCGAALFGHTHAPLINEETDLFVMNPGSPSRPRMGSMPSYGLLYIDEDGRVDGDILQIQPGL